MTEQTENQNGISIFRFEPDDCKRMEQFKYNKLWISDPATFNDPFELTTSVVDDVFSTFEPDNENPIDFTEYCHFKVTVKSIYENNRIDYRKFFNQQFVDKIVNWFTHKNLYQGMIVTTQQLIDSISDNTNHVGIRCFAKCYDQTLNWSHYSNSHKGFCVEYNFSPLQFLKNKSEIGLVFYNVSYTNHLKPVSIVELLLTPKQAFEKIYATKTFDWAYEQEIRFVHFLKKNDFIDLPLGLSVKSVIAGARMKPEHFELLTQISKELGIKLYKMEMNTSKPNYPLMSRIEIKIN